MIQFLTIFLMFWIFHVPIEGRNPRRPIDRSTPTITIESSDKSIAKQWVSPKIKKRVREKSSHTLQNSFLRIKPLKRFNHKFFKEHMLPQKSRINFRNNNGSIKTGELDQLMNEFVEELKAGQTSFQHFKVLKDKDFNYKTLSGLIVVKFKNYPFVLKLSIEHPHTMAQPYEKSFEATCIFFVGGNLRHLSNFTRIENLEYVKNVLSYNPYYLENLTFPRKWYWQPKRNYNLNITWHKTPYCSEELITMPSIYGVVSDFIETEEWPQQELNKLAMRISADVGFALDPHAGNCVKEKSNNKFTLLDTEDFRIMSGIDHTLKSKKYFGWYLEMAGLALQRYAGRTKQERIQQYYTL